MTSRRSMMAYSERVSRALQFVPGHVGGRVASAQPIRRRGGTLRSASVGASEALVVIPPPDSYARVDGRVMLGDYTNVDLLTAIDGTPGVGDIVVVAAAGSYTLSGPSGWTTLASGSNGAQNYWVGWRRMTGTDNFTLGSTGSASTAMYILSTRYTGIDAAYSVTLAGLNTASGATLTLPGASTGYLPAMMALALNPNNDGLYKTSSPAPSIDYTGGMGSAPTGAAYGWMHTDDAPTTDVAVSFWTDGSYTVADATMQSVALSYGFTA